MSKIIVCFLGTGAQSSGLVQKCLEDPDFTPRIVTRDPTTEKVQALVAKGAQAVKADLMQPLPDDVFATKEGETIYGAFVVTDFWGSCGMKAEKEIEQGRRIAEHIPSSVEHIIFSTLPDTRPYLGPLGVKPVEADYIVPHFEGKSIVEGFFPADKTTFLDTSFYYENFDGFGMCTNGVLTLPTKNALPAIASEDIGKAAYNIFKDPSLKGKRVSVTGELLSGDEYCKIMSEVTGKEFKYNLVDYEVYKGFGFHGAEELGNMFWFWDASAKHGDPVTTKESVLPELLSFREFCEQNKERIAKMAAA